MALKAGETMSESFRQNRHQAKRRQRTRLHLFLEELEGRCLMSVRGISVGPDGNLWFPQQDNWVPDGGDRIGYLNPSTGVIQHFNLPPGPFEGQIIPGPDGNLWLTRWDRIDRLTPSTGAVQEFPLPLGSALGLWDSMAATSDGNLWFPFSSPQGEQLGRLDPLTGEIKQFAFPPDTYAINITSGPDGNLWLTGVQAKRREFEIPEILRFDPNTAEFQEFPTGGVQGLGVNLQGITAGPDGNIWFTYESGVGRIDPTTGQIKEFNLPVGYRAEWPITAGSAGNLWFLSYGVGTQSVGEIDQINASTGSLNIIPMPSLQPTWITASPDGNLWLPEDKTGTDNTIAEFNPSTGVFQEFVGLGHRSSGQATSTGAISSNDSISVTGPTVSAAGLDFLRVVATFTPQVSIASPGTAYQAMVDWGDGATSSLVLTVTENGTYDVSAGHTYQASGTYTFKVTIGNYDPASPLGNNPITVFSTAQVDDWLNFNLFQ
jgi:virginiamycin B lyase